MNQEISIGLFCDYMHNPFHTEIISSLSEATEKKKAKLWCFEFSAINYDVKKITPQTFTTLIEKRNLKGIVILPGTLESVFQGIKFHSFLNEQLKIPVVSLCSPNLPIPSIHINNTIGMKKLLSHLIIEHGYRRLAYITGIRTISDFNQRYEDFISLCRWYGIHIDESKIFEANFDFESGRKAILDIIKADVRRFDVIVTANDQIAAGALLELRNHDISVPGNIAVTGFDDTKSALYADPPLTTVKQPLSDISFKAIDIIFEGLAGRTMPGNILIEPRLIIRRSCGCSMKERSGMSQGMDKQKKNSLPISYEKQDIVSYNQKDIERIIRYLGNQYAKPDLCLNDIADATGISQKKITRLIGGKYHISFKKLLNTIRSTEAKRLLEQTDLYITDIAFQVGYNSRTHFSRVFTSTEGISPREYRRRHLT
jgi:DNA-binding LacI/PurR family transcriptional regulator/AraC-like DNA-binding protein